MSSTLVVILLIVFRINLANSAKTLQCNLTEELITEIKSYQSVVNRIINISNGLFRDSIYNELVSFVDNFGPRFSGSKSLEDSIDYILDLMKKEALEVREEEVPILHWVRGEESAMLTSPKLLKIPVIGLGGSVSTPSKGIEAEVLVVNSFEQLKNKTIQETLGKIIVYNYKYYSYASAKLYRLRGAVEAAKVGALAALIRSPTPFSLRTLHTGQLLYVRNVTKIPSACITAEDANMLSRLQDRKMNIVIKLIIKDRNLPILKSRNAIGELKGYKEPEKLVVLSGHIDSWDVGTGAIDNAGGVFTSVYAPIILNYLGLKPRRTIRTILWTGEETGYWGSLNHLKKNPKESSKLNFVMESDLGIFNPTGFAHTAGFKGGCILKEIMKLFEQIGVTKLEYREVVGSDIQVWTMQGIPGAELLTANDKYFWYHHSQADTVDVIDPAAIRKSTAVLAAVAFVIADLKEDFPKETFPRNIEKEKILMQEFVNYINNFRMSDFPNSGTSTKTQNLSILCLLVVVLLRMK